jgi:pimeloyl-ACP methyl ester carboxylesterase
MSLTLISAEQRKIDFSSAGIHKTGKMRYVMNLSHSIFILLIIVLLACTAVGSPSAISRADLAIRLIEIETCWEAYRESAEARLRATRQLVDGITAFFAGRFDLLMRNLTLACAALRADVPPTPDMLYAGALGGRLPPIVGKESLEQGKTGLRFQLFSYYDTEKPGEPLQLRWQVLRFGELRPIREGKLNSPEPGATATLLTRAAEGDYEVRFELRHGNQTLRQWRQTFSVIANLEVRLDALERATKMKDSTDPIEKMTVLNALEVLRNAQKGESPETFYPLLRLLQLAEQISAGWEKGKPGWYAAPGDYWMAILYREQPVAFRLFIPRQFQPGRQIPLVVALHGAGGNEHLFFDGYGRGIVLKEAEKRGWAVIAPRAGRNLVHIEAALEAAEQLLPTDPERIYLMGHSMGGAHCFSAIAQFPDRFRGVAIFAGAGQPTQVPSDLPILMAVGEQELSILKTNVENAYRRLQELNLKVLDYKKYDGCEHLMIVREALPDAFAFFDRAPARRAKSSTP